MEINKYKVRVDFDMAVMGDRVKVDALASTLNQLFNVTVKMWAKDSEVLTTPTRTLINGEVDG